MSSWSYPPPPPPRRGRERLAAVRDLAIIAVCLAVLAFAALALLGASSREPTPAPRAASPAARV